MRNGRCVMYSHRRMKRERENMWCIWKDTFLIFVIVMKPGDNFTRAEGDHAIFVFSFHFSTRCAKFPLPLPYVTTGWIERRCIVWTRPFRPVLLSPCKENGHERKHLTTPSPLSSPPCSSQHFTFFPLFVRCRVYILYIFWLDVRLVLFPLLSSWLPFVLYIHIYIGVSFLFFLASFFFLCCFSPFHRTTCT